VREGAGDGAGVEMGTGRKGGLGDRQMASGAFYRLSVHPTSIFTCSSIFCEMYSCTVLMNIALQTQCFFIQW
jgi:hypothetical protein